MKFSNYFLEVFVLKHLYQREMRLNNILRFFLSLFIYIFIFFFFLVLEEMGLPSLRGHLLDQNE